MDEPQAPGNTTGGARCALHYGQPFTAVCQRCGTYMCQTCTEGGKFTVCPSCRSRTGLGSFPLRRDGFTWGQVTGFAWDVYKRNWALLLVAVCAAGVASAPLQYLTAIVQAGFYSSASDAAPMMDRVGLLLMLQALLIVPQMLLSALLTLGLMNISIKLVRGEPASISMLFGSWRKILPFVLQMVIIFAVMLPLFALFVVPFLMSIFSSAGSSDIGIGLTLLALPLGFIAFTYLMFGLAFGGFELIAQPNVGAVDGLRNSWSIARGQRLAILLGGIIAMGAIFLGLFACLIGVLFAYGYAIVLFATVYLTLRNGADGLVA